MRPILKINFASLYQYPLGQKGLLQSEVLDYKSREINYLSTLTVKEPCMSCLDSRYRTFVMISWKRGGDDFACFLQFLSSTNLINVLQQELVQLLEVHILRDNSNRGSRRVGRGGGWAWPWQYCNTGLSYIGRGDQRDLGNISMLDFWQKITWALEETVCCWPFSPRQKRRKRRNFLIFYRCWWCSCCWSPRPGMKTIVMLTL